MKYLITCLLALFLLTPRVNANDNMGLGLVYNTGDFVGVRLGDFGFFTSESHAFDVHHYGYGGGDLELGNGFGVNLSASSGMIAYELPNFQSGFTPILGFDFGGTANLNTNTSVHSFYEWIPAMTIGPEFKYDWGRIVLVGKEGVAAGNYDTTNVLPDFYFSQGAGLYFDSGHFCFGIDYTVFGDNQVGGLDMNLNINKNYRFDVRIEQEQNISLGLRDQRSSVMWKSDLW